MRPPDKKLLEEKRRFALTITVFPKRVCVCAAYVRACACGGDVSDSLRSVTPQLTVTTLVFL